MQNFLILILVYFCLSSCNGQDKHNIELKNKVSYLKDTRNTMHSVEGIVYFSTDNAFGLVYRRLVKLLKVTLAHWQFLSKQFM